MVLRDTTDEAILTPIDATPAANQVLNNPCLDCGACCAYFRVSFYCGELAGENGGWVPPSYVSQLSPLRACMKGTEAGHGRCIALVGELGKPGIRCRIYENRPSPCREFESWLPDGTPNAECQRLRLSLGLAPLPPRRVEDDDPHEPPTNPARAA